MMKVLIADDHKIVVDGLVAILKSEPDIEIIGTASNGREALEILENNTIDIAILDINMPIMNGVEATQIIAKNFPNTKVLVLSMYDTNEFIDELLEAGCQGYILKNKGQEELVTALNQIYKGHPYLGQRIRDKIMDEKMNPKKKSTEIPIKLTKREIEVIKLIGVEYTSPEISEKLFITEATVNTHRRNLISKLGVRNSLGLVRYAVENKLV